MPRVLDPRLAPALDRANPQTAMFVELQAPDVGQVLRRPDHWAGEPLEYENPIGGLGVDASGALTLSRTAATLATFGTSSSDVNLPRPTPATRLRGLRWTVDPTFGHATLRTFTATIRRKTFASEALRPLRYFPLALQIYRVAWATIELGSGVVSSPAPVYTFVPLLSSPVVVPYGSIAGWVANVAQVSFDLRGYGLEVGSTPLPGHPTPRGEFPVYYFELSPVNAPYDDAYASKRDAVSDRSVDGVGVFQDAQWTRTDAAPGWVEVDYDQVPRCTIEVEQHHVSTSAIYALDLGAAPAGASEGRVIFERRTPPGTVATLELSTAGFGGPYSPVVDGTAVPTKQQTYHLRTTLTAAGASRRVAPAITAAGIEFTTPVDVTLEANLTPISQSIDVPFCQAAIGEGAVQVLRTGRRDYRDTASDIAAGSAPSRLQARTFLGTYHPGIPEDAWFTLDRGFVSNRQPSATAERFSMLSYAKIAKKKIPARVETINSVHRVTSQTNVDGGSVVVVSPDLPNTPLNGGDYDGLGYYLRVRSSDEAGVETGFVQEIDASLLHDTLAFLVELPGTLVAFDEIEVHSARYQQPAVTWRDADLSDVWWEILTSYLGVPPERIGRSDLGRGARGGLPPSVTDWAPGDTATQRKLLVTLRLTEAESASELLDQVSFLMGGATVEIGGQIVFRQIYALRDANGVVTVPLDPPAAVFDVRDLIRLDTPTGLEQRIPTLACDYGVDSTLAGSGASAGAGQSAAKTVNYVDADAIVWLEAQDLDELAPAAIDKKIARWCFNAEDDGLYLATHAAQQVVRAASTGLRVWPWRATDARPQLTVGDTVIVITDQYTDYDPTRRQAIRGWQAYQLVLVHVADGGREFRGYMLGLHSAVQLQGGLGDLALRPSTLEARSITAITHVDSEDGTERVFTILTGDDVTELWVRNALVDASPTVSPWAGPIPIAVPLAVDPVTHLATYTALHPVQGKERWLLFDPRTVDYAAGLPLEVIVGPTPPRAAGNWAFTRKAGGLVDLTFSLRAAASLYPIMVSFSENGAAPFASHVFAEDGDVTVATVPALGDRELPLDTQIRYIADCVDVAGDHAWFHVPIDPPLVSFTLTPSEDGGTGTATLELTDPWGVVTDLEWERLLLGTTDTGLASTTSPGGGGEGTYTRDEPLDPKHTFTLTAILTRVRGLPLRSPSLDFDLDKRSNCSASAAIVDDVATIGVSFDTDTAIGAGEAEWSDDDGVTWHPLTVSAAYAAAFVRPLTASPQIILVRGYAEVSGEPGPPDAVPLPAASGTTGGYALDSVAIVEFDANHTLRLSVTETNGPADSYFFSLTRNGTGTGFTFVGGNPTANPYIDITVLEDFGGDDLGEPPYDYVGSAVASFDGVEYPSDPGAPATITTRDTTT